MLVLAFELHQGLPGDPARLVTVPVGHETARVVMVVPGRAGELGVAAVQGVRLPGGVGAKILGIVFEHLDQDVVEDVAHGIFHALPGGRAGFLLPQHLEDLGHGAGGVQVVLEGALDEGGLGGGQGGEVALGRVLQQGGHPLRHHRLGGARGIQAVADQGGRRGQQAGSRQQYDFCLDGFQLHGNAPRKRICCFLKMKFAANKLSLVIHFPNGKLLQQTLFSMQQYGERQHSSAERTAKSRRGDIIP